MWSKAGGSCTWQFSFTVRHSMDGGDVMTLRLMLGHTTLDVTLEQSVGEAVADFMLDRKPSARTAEYYELELRPFSAWLDSVGVACLGE